MMTENNNRSDERSIDPRNQEYDIKHGWYDSDNSRHNLLGRLAGTETWVCWRRWQVGRSETAYTVYGVGDLNIEPADLNVDCIQEAIETDAEKLHERGQKTEYDDYERVAETLRENAEMLAETLVEEYEDAVHTLLGDQIRQRGTRSASIPCNKRKVWTATEEPHIHEVDWAMKEASIEDTPDSQASSILKSALRGAIRQHQVSWADGAQEYIGYVRLSDDGSEMERKEREVPQ